MALWSDEEGVGFFVFMLYSLLQQLLYLGEPNLPSLLRGATKIDTTKPTPNINLIQHTLPRCCGSGNGLFRVTRGRHVSVAQSELRTRSDCTNCSDGCRPLFR